MVQIRNTPIQWKTFECDLLRFKWFPFIYRTRTHFIRQEETETDSRHWTCTQFHIGLSVHSLVLQNINSWETWVSGFGTSSYTAGLHKIQINLSDWDTIPKKNVLWNFWAWLIEPVQLLPVRMEGKLKSNEALAFSSSLFLSVQKPCAYNYLSAVCINPKNNIYNLPSN